MKKYSMYIFCVISIMFLFLIEANASNKIYSIDMNVYIDDFGNASVEEIWNTYLDTGTEGYRTFSKLGNSSINSFTLIDDTGTLYQYQNNWNTSVSFDDKAYKNGINYIYNGLELCWGISEYGDRTYTLKYNITNFVNQYTDKQGVYFNLLDIDQNVDKVNIKISSYIPLTVEEVKIWGLGYSGNIIFQDGSIVMSTDNLKSYDKLVFLGRFENDVFTTTNRVDKTFDSEYDEAFGINKNYYDNNTFNNDEEVSDTTLIIYLILLVVVGVLVIFLPFILIIIIVVLSKKKQKKDNNLYEGGKMLGDISNVNYYRDIPCDKNLYNIYYLMTCYFNDKNSIEIHKEHQKRIVVAIIMKWILEDKIDFQNDSLVLKITNYDDSSFDSGNYPHLERELYTWLRQVSKDNNIIEKNEFELWCEQNYNTLISWYDRIERNAEDFYRGKGFIKTINGSKEFDINMRQEALKIFGLKRFLIDFGRMYEKKTIEVSLWNYYLICAELFGIADKVKKELKNFYPELDIPNSINVSLIDTFVSVGYESMYKAKISEKISYSSSNSGSDSYHDYSGNDSYSGGGGSSFSSGGSSSGGSSGGGFR